MANEAPRKELAGFFRQVSIILWKNLLLYSQNKTGVICEILFSSLFTLVFIILVYFSTPKFIPQTDFGEADVISSRMLDSVGFFSARQTYYFYPNNDFVRGLVESSYKLIRARNPLLILNLVGTSVANAEQFNVTEKNNLFALVSFPHDYQAVNSLPDAIQYLIYTKEASKTKSYQTDEVFFAPDKYMIENSPEFFCQYVDSVYESKYEYFNTIKYSIDLGLLKAVANISFNPTNIKLKKFDCPSYKDDVLKSILGFMTPVLISLSFLVTFLLTISSVIEEKATKMKEYLKLIGVKPTVIWICWMARSLVIYLLLSIIVTYTSTMRFVPRFKSPDIKVKSLFLHTDASIVFATCIVYSIQVTSLSLLVGQIFSKAFLAKTVSIMLWLTTMINFYDTFSLAQYKYLFSVFPNSGLIFAVQVIFQYERSEKHLTLDTLFVSLFGDSLNLGGMLSMMLFWSACYLALSWYFEKIFPGEYGVKLPFYFPFMPSYWNERSLKTYVDVESNASNNAFNNEAFEREPNELNASVKIKNLTKKFRSGFEEKIAVDNISLNFYENQITGFLGYNGAGKTTTTFILCGLYAPTSGSIHILDQDIGVHMNKVRSLIGFCPQNKLIFI